MSHSSCPMCQAAKSHTTDHATVFVCGSEQMDAGSHIQSDACTMISALNQALEVALSEQEVPSMSLQKARAMAEVVRVAESVFDVHDLPRLHTAVHQYKQLL